MRWSKYISLLAGGLFCVFLACSTQKKFSPISSESYQLDNPGTKLKKGSSCRHYSKYIPYPDSIRFVPERRVRVIFHIMDSTGAKQNFSYEEAVPYFTRLLDICNDRYASNAKLQLPVGNDIPVLPMQIRLELSPLTDDPEDTGIYMHYDDELYWVVTKGKNANNYSRKVIKEYQTGGDSTLNIFVLAHHPDSVASPTYKAFGAGIAMGQSLKIYGMKESGKSPESFPGILQHEAGHIFGLSHTWHGRDGCDDTPKHENCWNYTKDGPCKTEVSNNMMDYNAWEKALSPCQIGKMHARFHRDGSLQRRMCIKDWCQMDYNQPEITISDTVEWTRSYDLQSNVTVRSGAVLKISCRVSMPAGGFIKLEKGATLILHNGHLHNSCGLRWNGIQTNHPEDAAVLIRGRSFIDDVAEEQQYPLEREN